jgi:hypothetical protein
MQLKLFYFSLNGIDIIKVSFINISLSTSNYIM